MKTSRIDIIGSNGNNGEHYKLAQTVMCPGEGCVIKNNCGRYVNGEYHYPVFGSTPYQLPKGGCQFFLTKESK